MRFLAKEAASKGRERVGLPLSAAAFAIAVGSVFAASDLLLTPGEAVHPSVPVVGLASPILSLSWIVLVGWVCRENGVFQARWLLLGAPLALYTPALLVLSMISWWSAARSFPPVDFGIYWPRLGP